MTVGSIVVLVLLLAFAVTAIWVVLRMRKAEREIDARMAAQRERALKQDIINRWEATTRASEPISPYRAPSSYTAPQPKARPAVKAAPKPKPVRHTGSSLADSSYTYESTFGYADYGNSGTSYSPDSGSSYSSDSGSSSSSSDSGSSGGACD